MHDRRLVVVVKLSLSHSPRAHTRDAARVGRKAASQTDRKLCFSEREEAWFDGRGRSGRFLAWAKWCSGRQGKASQSLSDSAEPPLVVFRVALGLGPSPLGVYHICIQREANSIQYGGVMGVNSGREPKLAEWDVHDGHELPQGLVSSSERLCTTNSLSESARQLQTAIVSCRRRKTALQTEERGARATKRQRQREKREREMGRPRTCGG